MHLSTTTSFHSHTPTYNTTTPHAAHRTPHTAHRTPYSVQCTVYSDTVHCTLFFLFFVRTIGERDDPERCSRVGRSRHSAPHLAPARHQFRHHAPVPEKLFNYIQVQCESTTVSGLRSQR